MPKPSDVVSDLAAGVRAVVAVEENYQDGALDGVAGHVGLLRLEHGEPKLGDFGIARRV